MLNLGIIKSFLKKIIAKYTFTRYLLLVILALICHVNSSKAQLFITTNRTVTDLVTNVLASKGVAISAITSSSNLNAIGFFDGRKSNIGLDSGIILSTGQVKNAAGLNVIGNTGTSNNQPGDPSITSIFPSEPNFDASWIRFRVTPESDTIRFRFVFASEEYPEFVSQSYNDVFGLFISGNEYTTETNLAIIPNTTTPISIQSVNPTTNSSYYRDNTNGLSCTFDGFTTVIEVKAKVTPCNDYELKFVIADIKDFIYDSGIFIEAQSLQSINKNAVTLSPLKDFFTECDSNSFVLTRNSDDLSTPITVQYKITGTAKAGIDYTIDNINTATIPVGVKRIGVKIKPFTDGVAEPSESISMKILSPVICDTVVKSITLIDYKTIDSLEFNYVCNDSTIRVTIRDFDLLDSIIWYNDKHQVASLFPTLLYNKKDTGYHYVRGVEHCTGRVIIDSVKILDYPITITGDTLICYGDTLKLLANSGLSNARYEWSNTTGGGFSPTPLSSGPTLIPENSGNITVEITNDGICSKQTYHVEVTKLTVEADTISICGAGNSTIIHASGGTQYKWTPNTFLDNDTIATPTCTPTSTITYSLKVSKGECSETFDVTVTVDTPITVKANNDIYICNREFATLHAEGSPNESYIWIPSSGLDSPTSSHPKANPISTTTYYVIGSNGSCKSVDSVTIFVINPVESNLEYSFDSCSRVFIGSQINATDSNEVTWNFGNGDTRVGKNIRYQYPEGGNYTVHSFVNPLAPCIDSEAVSIFMPIVDAAKRRIPDAFSPNGDGINDEFQIYFGNLPCAVKSFKIFNRWGQQVFEHQTGDALSWDGKLNGQFCEPGIYVYYLEGESFKDTGWLALIR